MPSEEEICDCIASMWLALYDADLTEDERARAVYDCHVGIDETLYLTLWWRLDWPFRNAWLAYVCQEHAFRGQVLRDCRRKGR